MTDTTLLPAFPARIFAVDNETDLPSVAVDGTACRVRATGKLYSWDQGGWSPILTETLRGSIGNAFEAEVDFGPVPTAVGRFTVANAAITATSKIVIVQSDATPTGGTGDEAEWDPIHVSAQPAAGSMVLVCRPLDGPVTGKFRFHYFLG